MQEGHHGNRQAGSDRPVAAGPRGLLTVHVLLLKQTLWLDCCSLHNPEREGLELLRSLRGQGRKFERTSCQGLRVHQGILKQVVKTRGGSESSPAA